eukprot:jgi/Astpho2/3556/fgenesh1_pg.00057_%23_33_t
MPTPPPVKTSTPDAAKDGEQQSQTGAAHPYRVAGRKDMQSIVARPRSRLGLTLLDCLADGEAAGIPGSSGALVVHQPGSQWRQKLRQSMAADLEQLQGPSGPAADAAVAALKAEVRCIRHSSVRASMGRGLAASLAACREGLQAQLAQDNHPSGEHSEASSDSEVAASLRLELQRLEQAHRAQASAQNALSSLQATVAALQLDVSLGPEGDPDDVVLMGTPDHEGCCSSLLLASPPADEQNPGAEKSSKPDESQAGDVDEGSAEGTEPGSPAPSSLASTVILDSGEKENSPQRQSSPIRGRGRQQRCSLNGPLRRSSAHNRSQRLADPPAALLDKAGLHAEGTLASAGTTTAGPAQSAGSAGRAADRAAAAYARPPEFMGTSPADTASSSRRALSAGRSPEVGQWAAEEAGERQVEVLRNAHAQALRELQARQQRELQQLQSSLQKDVQQLQQALTHYREQTERLECQKQLLIKQVLKLELTVEELQHTESELHADLARAFTEGRQARKTVSQLQAQLDAAAAGKSETPKRPTTGPSHQQQLATPAADAAGDGGPPAAVSPDVGSGALPPRRVPLLNLPRRVGIKDSIDVAAALQAAQELLPRIVALWHALHVPLVHRSRFYLAFQGREAFYFESEHRRLVYLAGQSSVDPGTPLHGQGALLSPNSKTAAAARLSKAARKLEWERRWLAQQMKYEFTPEERADLFVSWNVHRDSRERKLQLTRQLWAPTTIRDPDGMTRSSELVMRLNGSEASDGTEFDLVFGRSEDQGWMRNMLSSSVLGPVLTKMGAVAPSPSRPSATGGPGRRRSFMGALGLTPRRNSGVSAASGSCSNLARSGT